jgi:leukotriene-A4 hydrolase
MTLHGKAWFHGEGLNLPVEMVYDTTLVKHAYTLAKRWDTSRDTSDLSMFNKSDIDGFSANQISA